MTTKDLFIQSFPIDNARNMIIDPNGDTILTLQDLYDDGVQTNGNAGFQVSSTVLQRQSFYFKIQFRTRFAPTKQADGKYHVYSGYIGADLVGFLILLLAMHQDFSTRTQDGRYLAVQLPATVPLNTLISIMDITDYFIMRRACDILADSSASWFEQFKRNGKWAVPKKYKARLMMWWCLAREFEPCISGGDTLQMAVKRVIFKHEGTIANNEWPIRQAEFDGLEEDRKWHRFG